MTPGERLREARMQSRFKDGKEVAAYLNMPYSTYAGHENGSKGAYRASQAATYAKLFKVRMEWLLTGKGPMRDTKAISVLGYVGAGAEVYPIDDHAQGAGLDTVDASIPDPSVALIIRGDSQHPLQDGWVIIYQKEQDGVPDSCIGRLCVAKVHEGPTLLKTVRRGKTARTFDLESWNAPLREGVRLDWATPVLMIRPK